MKNSLMLVIFNGCPNADQARKLLQGVGVSFEEVIQDDLPSGHPHRDFSSPTLLAGDQIVFGSKVEQGSSGCSFGLPSAEDLKVLLSSVGG